MKKDKKILGIITARSGSKGVVDKNIKLINGKSMLIYTIEEAIKSKVFDDLIISTDSQKYADLAIKAGATMTQLRPEHLATDTAKSVDVIKYELEELEKIGKKYDYFMILQPTSPLRKAEDIIGAVNLMIEKDADNVLGMCECEHPPEWGCNIDESLNADELQTKMTHTRRQDLKKSYRLNGAIFLSKVENFKRTNNIYAGSNFAYIMNRFDSMEIDSEDDFILIEMLLKKRELSQ